MVLYTWGGNSEGQLGVNKNTSFIAAPVKVNIPATIATVSAGGYYMIALADNGTSYGWGDAQRGELGTGVGGTVLL
jgi:alpha-tubulin suppressor-like RCC1 family protein